MPVIATADQARPTRRRASSNGTGFWLTSYIGANRYTPDAAAPPEPGEIYPMAFWSSRMRVRWSVRTTTRPTSSR